MRKQPEAHIDTAMIERAVRFEATIFLGTGRFHSASFDLLADARDAARQFGEVAKNGRKGLVYAVTAEGRSTLVPDSYQPATLIEGKPQMTSIDTKFSGIEVSKLTAVITGGGFKRANSKDAAIARYLKVAAEAGVRTPEKYIGADYDYETAEHVLFELKKGGFKGNGAHASIPEVQAASPKAEDAEAAMQAEAEATTKPRQRKASKPAAAPAPKAEPAKPAKAPAGQRAKIAADAANGIVPAAPDFSAETHKRFRPKLAQVVALVAAKDIAGLEAFEINPVSSSPKAIAKFRDLAVIALKAYQRQRPREVDQARPRSIARCCCPYWPYPCRGGDGEGV